MEHKDKKNELGTLKINNEVIASIARNAAVEVDGVLAIKTDIVSRLREFFQHGYNNQGIILEIAEGEVAVSLSITVRYGVTIPDVATAVQDNIRDAVERYTGLTVAEVNVNVAGVTKEDVPTETETKGEDDACI